MRLAPFFITIFFAALLASCGQKGPLYLPEPETAEALDQQSSQAQMPETGQTTVDDEQNASSSDSEASPAQP